MDEKIKLSVTALAKMKGETLKEFAEHCGIPYNHLRLISCNRTQMLAKDMYAISVYTGVPMQNIKF